MASTKATVNDNSNCGVVKLHLYRPMKASQLSIDSAGWVGWMALGERCENMVTEETDCMHSSMEEIESTKARAVCDELYKILGDSSMGNGTILPASESDTKGFIVCISGGSFHDSSKPMNIGSHIGNSDSQNILVKESCLKALRLSKYIHDNQLNIWNQASVTWENYNYLDTQNGGKYLFFDNENSDDINYLKQKNSDNVDSLDVGKEVWQDDFTSITGFDKTTMKTDFPFLKGNDIKVFLATRLLHQRLQHTFEFNMSDKVIAAPVLYGGIIDNHIVGVLSMRVWT